MAGGNILYDMVGAEPALLTNYARAFDNEVLRNQFALERYLPNEQLEDLEYRVATGEFRDVDVAEYRAFDTQARMTGRQGFGEIRGAIPPLGRGIPLGEEHLHKLRQVQGGERSGLVRQIYADVERMVRSVQGRVELARGQLLTTGKVTINENGVQLEADFGLSGTHNVDAAVSHYDPAADVIGDLLAWQEVYVDDTGIAPAEFLCSTRYINALLRNTGVMTHLGVEGIVQRVTVEGLTEVLANYALPVPVIYDTKVRVNGTHTRVIAEDLLVFLPPQGEQLGRTFYGITAEAIELAGRGLIETTAMPGIVALAVKNEQPVQTFTYAHAIALPVLPNPDLLFVADIDP